jgi:hypothetical protein
MKLNRSILNARLAKMKDVMICREVIYKLEFIPDGREGGCCLAFTTAKQHWSVKL